MHKAEIAEMIQVLQEAQATLDKAENYYDETGDMLENLIA